MRARGPLLALGIGATLCAAGCKREPTFDERYAAAQKSVNREATAINRELALRERERLEAEAAMAERSKGAAHPTESSKAARPPATARTKS